MIYLIFIIKLKYVDAIDDGLPALILNTYTKTEVGALLSNIILTDSYMKTGIDTTRSDYSTISYAQGNYMTSLLMAQALMNNYASVSLLNDNLLFKNRN